MSIEIRQARMDELLALASQHGDVRVLEADLMSTVNSVQFKRRYPDQFIQCGLAEANMMGIAAGLSSTGKIPFVHSFGCFITRRCYDQVFLSGGHAQQHINIYGSDAGVSAVVNGGSHMAFEDIGLMRLVPNATVVAVSDQHVMRAATEYSYYHHGINYIRSTRKALPDLYTAKDDICIGKGQVLREGDDLTIIATGLSVHDALKAALQIEKLSGQSVAVIDMHTIKPLDVELTSTYAAKTGRILTVENHNVIGGLGDAVLSALAETGSVPSVFHKLGVIEKFGCVGDIHYLKEVFEISSDAIQQAGLNLLSKPLKH